MTLFPHLHSKKNNIEEIIWLCVISRFKPNPKPKRVAWISKQIWQKKKGFLRASTCRACAAKKELSWSRKDGLLWVLESQWGNKENMEGILEEFKVSKLLRNLSKNRTKTLPFVIYSKILKSFDFFSSKNYQKSPIKLLFLSLFPSYLTGRIISLWLSKIIANPLQIR